jgi:hypothetical protein
MVILRCDSYDLPRGKQMTDSPDSGAKNWVLRVGWIVVAVGPPTAVGATSRHLISRYPVTAALLLLAYWIAVAAARFAGAVAGELAQRWRGRLVNHIDDESSRRLSGFGKRYFEYVLGSLRFIDQKGLPTVGFYTPELDEVFVDVSLARRPMHETSADPIADLPPSVTERLSIGEFLDRDEPVILAVTGAPGSGKTTLLRHTAREICRSHRGRRRHVPILLYLRDHANAIVGGQHDELPALIRAALGHYGPEPAGWFEQRLRDGDCIVLLDGLDEVARDHHRRTVSAWIERQITQYPKNDYVITSRPHGYRTAPVDGAVVVQTRRFTEDQITRFVEGWYLAVERRSTGTDGEDVRMLATSGASDLLERLKNTPALYDLTANPLLLTMITNVHRFRGALPGSRADLYRDICEVMLWRRHEAKKLTAEIAGEQKEVLLRALAFAMMQRNVRDLEAEEILIVIEPGLSRISSEVSAQDFLDDVGSSGLLIERENSAYSFAHHTFQEYLAAVHIRERKLTTALTEAVNDEWWRETTLLYTARSDADPIVRACLDSGSVTALTLAFDCAEQRPELALSLRRQLDDLLSLDRPPGADLERRRLVTRILVTRQLRHVTSLSNGGHLCAQPITNKVYQIFVYDMKARGQNREPDGPWPVSGIDEAVIGVRAGDAIAFVAWVNDVIGDTAYRLPTRGEVNDPSTRIALRNLWLNSDSDEPARWAASGSDQPRSIDGSAITYRLKRDIESSAHLPLRLLIIRSLAVLALIARDTDVIDLVHDRGIAKTLARDLALAAELAGRIDPVLAEGVTVAYNHALTREHHPSLDRIVDLADSLNRSFNRTLSRELDPILDRGLAHGLDRALDRAIGVDREADREVSMALDLKLDLARAIDINLGHPGRVIDMIGNYVMGVALGCSLSSTLDHTSLFGELDSASSISTRLYRNISFETGSDHATYAAALESLADSVRIRDLLDASTVRLKSQWGHETVRHLTQVVIPIFSREHNLNRQSAAAIRLTSLCLAAEISAHTDIRRDGDIFREIAAGVTLLEQRVLGEHPPTEGIILAPE